MVQEIKSSDTWNLVKSIICDPRNLCTGNSEAVRKNVQQRLKSAQREGPRTRMHQSRPLPLFNMFGADPKFSKEPATKAFRSLLSGREATACYAAAQTHTRRAESAGFTMRHLTNRLRESLNLRGLQCATSRTAENLNLPEPVHYATQKRRPSPRRGSSLHCSLPVQAFQAPKAHNTASGLLRPTRSRVQLHTLR